MEFSFGSVVASLFISGTGWVFFRHGKKKGSAQFLVVGIGMMIYPYFVSDIFWMIGIAVVLCGYLYWVNH